MWGLRGLNGTCPLEKGPQIYSAVCSLLPKERELLPGVRHLIPDIEETGAGLRLVQVRPVPSWCKLPTVSLCRLCATRAYFLSLSFRICQSSSVWTLMFTLGYPYSACFAGLKAGRGELLPSPFFL